MNRGLIEVDQARIGRIAVDILPRFMNRGLIEVADLDKHVQELVDFPDS